MPAYFKASKSLKKDNGEEKIICYPGQIRSNVGARILFDIIAPEVARHSYIYSPYKNNTVGAVADDVSGIEIEGKIVRFIESLISKFVEAAQKNVMQIEECRVWVNISTPNMEKGFLL